MKKILVFSTLLYAFLLPSQAQALFVLEPEVEVAFGGQTYQVSTPPGFEAEGVDAFVLTGQYVPGLRLSFYDYGLRPLPLGLCLGVAYAFAQVGAQDYDNNLGKFYDLKRLKLSALACLPFFKKDTGIMTANLGGYYALPLGGTYDTATTNYPRDLGLSDMNGDYGLRAELSFLAAFAYYEGGKPAVGGVSATVYAEINLNDLSPLSVEEIRYWGIGFGFGVPFYF